ncbi:DUF2249 domain-containing protein [Desulfosporosinus burensis]
MTSFAAQIDVRQYAPKDKQPNIFSTWNSLKSGETMELTNDHDPKPLYYLFSAEHAGLFTWDYLQEGPDVWRVAITKK